MLSSAVRWLKALLYQRRSLGDELKTKSNSPTTVVDPFADHPMHCKCYHHR